MALQQLNVISVMIWHKNYTYVIKKFYNKESICKLKPEAFSVAPIFLPSAVVVGIRADRHFVVTAPRVHRSAFPTQKFGVPLRSAQSGEPNWLDCLWKNTAIEWNAKDQ